MTDAERDAVIKALTVTSVSASAECKTDQYGNVAYEIGSLLGVPPRLWPDAPSTPISATDPTAARVELQTAICKDPNLGSAWLTFMATTLRDKLLAATGIDLVKLNPELKAYTDQKAITIKATTFVPLLNIEKPTTAEVDNAVKQNAAWQKDAAVANTLLERFAALGIDSRQSIVNYHLTDYALSVHALPTVGVNDKEESLPADVYGIVDKGQCGERVAFGANRGDKRPELFEAKTCAPPTTTTPGCVPTATHKCSSTPGCTSNCGTTTCTGTSCSCPPGNTIPDCAPKSHNPGDYPYPSGKPKATVTTPPETSPPPVTTTQTGGGGVTDTSTNKPGSETGTTAPGATAPSTAPSAPPVNEGGDN